MWVAAVVASFVSSNIINQQGWTLSPEPGLAYGNTASSPSQGCLSCVPQSQLSPWVCLTGQSSWPLIHLAPGVSWTFWILCLGIPMGAQDAWSLSPTQGKWYENRNGWTPWGLTRRPSWLRLQQASSLLSVVCVFESSVCILDSNSQTSWNTSASLGLLPFTISSSIHFN